jgi:hypothetical protein
MKLAGILGAAAAALAMSACAEHGASAPLVPGAVDVTLEATDDSTGALVLSVIGGRVDSVVAVTGSVYSEADANGASIFSAGTLLKGSTVVRIYVPDASTAAAYQVIGVEAANGGSFAQRAPGSWQVRTVVGTP